MISALWTTSLKRPFSLGFLQTLLLSPGSLLHLAPGEGSSIEGWSSRIFPAVTFDVFNNQGATRINIAPGGLPDLRSAGR